MAKHTHNGTTTFAWDGDCILSDQQQGRGPREFVFYPGTFEPLAAIDADKSIYYFHNDNVGAPQEVTDDLGNIVWSARYDATGGIEKLFTNTFDNPIRLQGQYADDELGLYYNRHRYFDPRIGAFISQDPLGIAAGENLYAYAPNVWGWVDPLGLEECPNSNASKSGWDNVIKFKYKGYNKLGANEKKIADNMVDRFQQRYLAGAGDDLSNIRNVRNLKDGLYEIKSKQGVRVYIDKTGNVLGYGNKNSQAKDIPRLKNLLESAGY